MKKNLSSFHWVRISLLVFTDVTCEMAAGIKEFLIAQWRLNTNKEDFNFTLQVLPNKKKS